MAQQSIAYLVGLGQQPWPIFVGSKVTFGRDPSCSHVLIDAKVSRNHAVLDVTGIGLITLEDLASSNGTLLNDKRIEAHSPQPLKSGDTFAMGSVVVTLLADKSSRVATSLAKEQSRLGSGVTPVSGRIDMKPGKVGSERDTRAYPPVGPKVGSRTTQIQSMTDSVVERLGRPCKSEGSLEEFWFPQILQTQHRNGMTGELFLERDGKEATISFDGGEIIFAMMEEFLGVDVIAKIASWNTGTFRFKVMKQVQRPQNIRLPTKAIILQCCQFIEEPGNGDAG